MFYRNSQGNIINLDNVREIVKHPDITIRERNSGNKRMVSELAYYVEDETYMTLERFEDRKSLDEFADWLWGQIHDEFSTCSFDEFTKKTVKYAPLKR